MAELAPQMASETLGMTKHPSGTIRQSLGTPRHPSDGLNQTVGGLNPTVWTAKHPSGTLRETVGRPEKTVGFDVTTCCRRDTTGQRR